MIALARCFVGLAVLLSIPAFAADAPPPSGNSLTAILTFLGGGVGTALVSHFLGRRKAAAEVDKIRAETNKINLEVQKLSSTVKALSAASEQILLDGSKGLDGFSVKGQSGRFWKGNGKDATAPNPMGEGELLFESDGVLNIRRANTVGRYELLFRQFTVGDEVKDVIPKNEAMSGKRKIRVSCEAKTVGGSHTLRFVIRNPLTKQRFAESSKTVNGNEWTKLDVFLLCNPAHDVHLRVDDEEVSIAPSSVQLRKVVIAERIA